jgi:hypothetical protein
MIRRRLAAAALGAFVLAAFAAGGARAADCFAPLAVNPRWSCTARLPNGDTIDYCLNLTGSAGSGASRRFDMVTTGPFPRSCSCTAKGKGSKLRFNAAPGYLCYDDLTETAETGAITKKKISGETYNLSAEVRTTFECRVDAACVVQP